MATRPAGSSTLPARCPKRRLRRCWSSWRARRLVESEQSSKARGPRGDAFADDRRAQGIAGRDPRIGARNARGLGSARLDSAVAPARRVAIRRDVGPEGGAWDRLESRRMPGAPMLVDPSQESGCEPFAAFDAPGADSGTPFPMTTPPQPPQSSRTGIGRNSGCRCAASWLQGCATRTAPSPRMP
jgi:hypothetical protein